MTHLRRLWANLHILTVGVYLLLSVIPATSGKSLRFYDLRPVWIGTAVVAAVLCFASIRWTRCRVVAGALASSYIVVRAVYLEWQFGELAPWSSFAVSIALAVSIAWSWGRPPIVGKTIDFDRTS